MDTEEQTYRVYPSRPQCPPWWRVELLLALLALLAQTALAQQPVTGSIQGFVSRAGTNEALSKATVEIRGDNRSDGSSVRPDYTTTTGSDGRFLIPNVRPGRYRAEVTRPGYVRRTLGVAVFGGQTEDLRAPLMPTAAISGRVYGSSGEPLGNVDVAALTPSYLNGRRTLAPLQTVRTDDRGEYRLFWLPPGRYYVRATHPDAQGPMERMMGASGFVSMFFSTARPGFNVVRSTGDPAAASLPLTQPAETQPVERYMPVYFPGTIAEQAALVVDLSPGADAGGVDIPLAPVRARHVRGVVINGATGQLAQYAGLEVDGSDVGRAPPPGFFARDALKIDPEGSFDLTLFPGPHTLMGTAGTGVGYAFVDVGDADIEGVQIIAIPAVNIAGWIVVEGPLDQKAPGGSVPSADLEDLRISLRRDLPVQSSPSLFAPPDNNVHYSLPRPDGSFVVEATPGDLQVSVAPLLNLTSRPNVNPPVPASLQHAYVKSVRLGDVDVLNSGLRLQGSVAGSLEIVIGTATGVFEGGVSADGQPAGPGTTVVLMPDVRRRTDLYKTTTTDPAGRFHMENVPPGSYRAFAWQDVSDGAWHDPDFMPAHEARGATVAISEGRTTNIQLTVIPTP